MRRFDPLKRHQSSHGAPSPEATQRFKVIKSGLTIISSLGTQPEIVFLENCDDIHIQGVKGNEGIDAIHALFPVLIFHRT